MKKSLNTFLMQLLGYCRFLDPIWLQKTVFWTNIKENVFFSIQYLNIFKFTATFVDDLCVLSYKKSRNGCKTFFMNATKNKNTFFQKKVLVSLKMPKIAPLNTLKLFFSKMFYYVFVTFVNNAFATIS